MTTAPVGIERRIGQRFCFNLPVSLRDVLTAAEGLGFTQDLSSRGAFLFTTMVLTEGAEVELTLKMPSEITLGDSMRVRCRGRVLRVVNAADNGWKPASAFHPEIKSLGNATAESSDSRKEEVKSPEIKIGVAVCVSGYEYLPETEDSSADFRRISALHGPSEPERTTTAIPGNPRAVAH